MMTLGGFLAAPPRGFRGADDLLSAIASPRAGPRPLWKGPIVVESSGPLSDVDREPRFIPSGSSKYCATACLTGLLWPVIHITRKKAIMAVTKSAYATFQAPPPPAAIAYLPLPSRRFGLFEQLIQLGAVRPIFGVDPATGLFHRDFRRVAVRKGDNDRRHRAKECG